MKRFTIITLATLAALSAAPLALAATRLQNIQTKGGTDITARTTSLTGLSTRAQAAKRLTTEQKSSLAAEMQTEVTGLNDLKTKLNAETAVAPALVDFDNIFKAHYIYAFYLPRVERIMAADAESDAATNLTSLASKLETAINSAEAAGNDITVLDTRLTEVKAKAADAQTQAQTVLTALLPLKASGYPDNKTAITGAVLTLKTGRADLEVARNDAKSIVAALRLMFKK